MIPSIRTFLLINLLLSVTLITSFAVIANLFLEHKDVQIYLDEQLAFRAMNIQAFVSGCLKTEPQIKTIQSKINEVPGLTSAALKKVFPMSEQIQFQIWDANQKVILSSKESPTNISFKNLPKGFSDVWIDGEPWRFFVTADPDTNATVVVSEKYELREGLETHITRDSILIMLISYPFLGLLIWLIVGRGLDSLKKVASEVRNREPTYLEPVNTESVPAEIKPMIDELNELFHRLREAFEREKRFAADAAHELRTPLAALKAHAQVALKASTDEEKTAALRKVVVSVDRSTHVVQQLLTLSQMVPEASPTELVPVDLNKQAAEVIADLVPFAIAKNTEIELIAPETISPIMAFPTAINILIRNLVDNAIRYTPANSWVRVVISEDSESVILKVIDNGPGIPEELRERVFERFFRLLGNKSTGSGLGLGIVQQVAELNKAKVILDTPKTGQGLEVTVIFSKDQSNTKRL